MNQKDKFLQDVTKDIKYIFARKKIRKELENHILEGLDAGFSEDEVISDMGNPKIISNEFNKVYTMVSYLYILLVISALIIFSFLFFHYLDAKKSLKEVEASKFQNREMLIRASDDYYAIDERIILGNYDIVFTDVFFHNEEGVFLLYESNKINPLNKENILYEINTCNETYCKDEVILSLGEYGFYINPLGQGVLRFQDHKIPETITLQYKHKYLKDLIKEFDLTLGGSHE